ncbi:Peptidase C13, legumain [Trema orientale]|uniref:Peptidase C13, legumain n=1 Tax=Trema orientale TaxID=63057 RepID=A0A2P5BC92_TREOI|nr:Peptidase C13, legumain [Trema orientale]
MKSTGTVLMFLVLVILCISITYATSARLADNVFTKFLNSDENDDVPETTSQVQQLGDISIANDFVSTYMGSRERLIHQTRDYHSSSSSRLSNFKDQVPCAERELEYFHNRRSRPDSPNYIQYKKELDERLAKRKLEDDNFAGIRKLLFKDESGSKVKNVVNEVQRYNCFKSFMDIYWKNCGSISEYGMRFAKEFDKMCDVGVTDDEFMAAST